MPFFSSACVFGMLSTDTMITEDMIMVCHLTVFSLKRLFYLAVYFFFGLYIIQ